MIFEEIEYYKISDWEDYYISKCGKVLSTKGKTPRILKFGTDRYGYHYVNLCSNGKRKVMKVHRLVAKVFLQNYTEDLQVDHKNNDKTNNNLTNLRMTTSSDNNRNRLKAVGVIKLFDKRRGTYNYQVSWFDDTGKRHRKSFSVIKYGDEIAHQKATELRQEMVTKYYNRPQLF